MFTVLTAWVSPQKNAVHQNKKRYIPREWYITANDENILALLNMIAQNRSKKPFAAQ